MGCISSKEPVQHGIITYCVCRGCQASPVRDETRLCGKCEHAKASGRPVRPRQLCPSCQTETVTYTGEICATCAVKARQPESSAVARLPGTILSNAPARRGASSQQQRGSKKIVIERGHSGGTPPQRQSQRDGVSTKFYIDRGHSGETPPQSKAARSSKYNPDRMSSRLPLRMPNREIPVF